MHYNGTVQRDIIQRFFCSVLVYLVVGSGGAFAQDVTAPRSEVTAATPLSASTAAETAALEADMAEADRNGSAPPMIVTTIAPMPRSSFSDDLWQAEATADTGFAVGILSAYSILNPTAADEIPARLGVEDYEGDRLSSVGFRIHGMLSPYARVGFVMFQGVHERQGAATTTLERELLFKLTYGAMNFEAVYPMKWLEIGAGIDIGWTTIAYTHRQMDTSTVAQSYDVALDGLRQTQTSGTFTRTLVSGFFGARPSVNVGLRMLPWLTIYVRGSYDYWMVPANSLLYSEYRAPLQGSPSLSLGRATIETALMFGFFPYR